MNKQILYKIIKINTSKIHSSMVKEKNSDGKIVKKDPIEYNIGSYSYNDAFKNNEIVSIGDNLIFHKIREFYGENRSPDKLYEIINNLYNEQKKIKSKQTSQENITELKKLNEEINNIVYISDIVNVKVTNKSHYKDIAISGFWMNGKKYKRLCCGSGQMRRNTVTFVNENLYDYLINSLMCGLNGRIKKINLAKFSAYFALSFSSVLWVRNPRICVIDDFETLIPKQKIDFIVTDSNDNKHIEERIMDLKLNSADGMGLITPQCSKWFSEDIGLPNGQIACQFVIRSAFVKGCVCTFDFVEYANKVCGINKIKSIYGEEFNINEIDILLTKSQFKMNKYYNSVKEYVDFHNKFNLKWGVARYNKIPDDNSTLLNYQYIQNNNLNDNDIDKLIQPTINWFKNICSGKKIYSLLYSIGCRDKDETYNQILNDCGSLFTKAILKNSDMLNDGYIRKKIYNSIKESFRKAKLGRVWCNGSYQFMISDPVPLIRNALGLSPIGLIPANSVYSNYWNLRNVKMIDLMRSPMVDRHEHNIVKVVNTSEMNNWYKYIYSGIIYSIYDTGTIRHSDSDFDGDIVFSTDNSILINGAYRYNNPITYDKKKAPEIEMTYENIVKCDLNGFDTLVGQITNNSTSINAMLPNFPKEKYPEEYNELIDRLKILREIIGSEIDKIKLGVSPKFPEEWIKRVNINESDSDIVKAKKYKHNSLVINKKAYFMIYIYEKLMRSYQNHIKQFDLDCKNKFGMSYLDLKYQKVKTKAQLKFIKRVKYFSPVLDTPCIMNKLCHKFEKIEKEIIYDKSLNDSMLSSYNKHEYYINDCLLLKLERIYKQYQAQKKFINVKHFLEEFLPSNDYQEYLSSMIDVLNKEYSDKCYELISNYKELFEYLIKLSDKIGKNFDFSFVWIVIGDNILNIIPYNSQVCIEDTNGTEYLGKRYKIVEVVNDNLE